VEERSVPLTGDNGATDDDLAAAVLFALLWEGLADVLGTAATAALVRRAARGAMLRYPELVALVVVRENLEYRYTVPSAWNQPSSSAPAALRELASELRPLLIELTGSVVVRHLARIPELRARGILFLTQEEQP
jgi:hypothetical protein